MPMFEDSGVSLPSNVTDEIGKLDEQISNFDGSNVDALNRLCAQRIRIMSQAEIGAEPASEPRARELDDIASEVFTRLMQLGTDKANTVADRVAALEASWRVFADFARLSNGE